MGSVRASDREREATLRVLGDGRAEGRLSTSTFEERVERALTASSTGELRQLTVDVERVTRVRAWWGHVRGSKRPAAGADEASLRLSELGTRPFSVGRSGEADLVVGDLTVSRLHAQILRTADGFVLTDLGSTNGTWLGGRRVGQVQVVPGDAVLLGDLTLHLR
jgi:predicted component of type VI protein secretion system